MYSGMNQCMGCQAKWPRAGDWHYVIGGYPGERVWCTQRNYQDENLPSPGHCSLGSCCSHALHRAIDAAAMAPRVVCADFAAPGTKDQTILFTHVTEEDFELMLEVDLAYTDWLRRRNLL